ncbi:MAG: nonstructural protein [Microvirus sp.]|nr:MAG: nonstructural protein [Microvirus sp.]
MITNAYAIFDNKALIYNVPWFQPTHGAATRILADLVNDGSTNVGRHPGDYVLYQIGTYDDAKGEFIPLAPLVHIMDAIALVRLQPDFFQPNVGNQINNGAGIITKEQI